MILVFLYICCEGGKVQWVQLVSLVCIYDITGGSLSVSARILIS